MSQTRSPDTGEHLYMLRLGAELATKSRRTRSHFQQRLLANVEDALTDVEAATSVQAEWSRLYVRSASDEALPVLQRVFGLSSISPVEAVVPAELDRIVEAGRRAYGERVKGRRFAVRARRTGEHSFSSMDIQVQLGAALNPGADVDLDDPDIRIEVEVREDQAFLFHRRYPGAGGLPLGVEGRALALISGGYDSAVAAALMLRRGVELDYVFCNLGGEAYERSVLNVVKVLADRWSYGTRPSLFAVDFGEVAEELTGRVRPAHVQVVLKRLMYRAGSRIAHRIGADALITGEAIGQVSSQTLKNLRAIDPAASLPVFRPVLGFDKDEIIERARALGTATLSAKVKEYCQLVPDRPVTAASPAAVAREEGKVRLVLVEETVDEARRFDVRSLSAAELVEPYLFTTQVPEDAVVVDCRSPEEYAVRHFPGAVHHEGWRLMREYRELDKDPVYVLYCAHGVQTPHLAERMQREGYEAYSFRGGVRRILEATEPQPAT
jgi:tRNA uracil 4-sulfurtransferase